MKGAQSGVVNFRGGCGYRGGDWTPRSVRSPLAILTIEPDFLLIHGGPKAFWEFGNSLTEFQMHKDFITKISECPGGFFSKGFRVEHNNFDLPDFVAFYPENLDAVVMELERLDYRFSWDLPR